MKKILSFGALCCILLLSGCETTRISPAKLTETESILVVNLYPNGLWLGGMSYLPAITKSSYFEIDNFTPSESITTVVDQVLTDLGYQVAIVTPAIDRSGVLGLSSEDRQAILAEYVSSDVDLVLFVYAAPNVAQNGRQFDYGGVMLSYNRLFGIRTASVGVNCGIYAYDPVTSKQIAWNTTLRGVFREITKEVDWVNSWEDVSQEDRLFIVDALEGIIQQNFEIVLTEMVPRRALAKL